MMFCGRFIIVLTFGLHTQTQIEDVTGFRDLLCMRVDDHHRVMCIAALVKCCRGAHTISGQN